MCNSNVLLNFYFLLTLSMIVKSLLAIVCMIFLAGCSKKLPPQPIFLVTHKQTVTLLGTLDSKDTIYVASNGGWTVIKDLAADWINVEPTGGTGDSMIIIST